MYCSWILQRKQELLVSGEDTDLRVKASYAASEDEEATSEE
ncbi:hypothetical protein PC129_g23428, partial [Phytophthora cactorum]